MTATENKLRGNGFGGKNRRKTHCPQGHPYDAANTYLTRAGKRNCRACLGLKPAKESSAA